MNCLDEVARLMKRLVCAGVEPGHAAAEQLDLQLISFQVGDVHIGDFEFASGRGIQLARDLYHLFIVEVEARHGVVGEGSCRFLLDRFGSSVGVEADDAVALGILYPVAEDGGAATARRRSFE